MADHDDLAAHLIELTNEAVPDEVLADRSVAQSPGVTVVGAGRRSLRGFAEPVEVWTITAGEPD